jgi:hypothetical protein
LKQDRTRGDKRRQEETREVLYEDFGWEERRSEEARQKERS